MFLLINKRYFIYKIDCLLEMSKSLSCEMGMAFQMSSGLRLHDALQSEYSTVKNERKIRILFFKNIILKIVPKKFRLPVFEILAKIKKKSTSQKFLSAQNHITSINVMRFI